MFLFDNITYLNLPTQTARFYTYFVCIRNLQPTAVTTTVCDQRVRIKMLHECNVFQSYVYPNLGAMKYIIHVFVKMFIKLKEYYVKTFFITQSIHFDTHRREVQIKSRGRVCSPRHLASSEDTVPDESHQWWSKRRCECKCICCVIRTRSRRSTNTTRDECIVGDIRVILSVSADSVRLPLHHGLHPRHRRDPPHHQRQPRSHDDNPGTVSSHVEGEYRKFTVANALWLIKLKIDSSW